MKIPKIIKHKGREFILEKVYPNHVLYSDLEYGVKECFSFYELGMIKEMVKPYKKQYKEGIMFFKNII